MTALGEVLATLNAARAAAEAGDFALARTLLEQAEVQREQAEQTYGLGNAAHAQRRAKLTRTESDVRALLPAEPEPAAPEVAAPSPATVAPTEKKARAAAPAHALSAEEWSRVAAGLVDRDSQGLRDLIGRREAERAELLIAGGARFEAKVAEREILQAQVELAALTGDVEAGNAAWDRLFDVCTQIRTLEGAARRAGKPELRKTEAHEQARGAAARIRRLARGQAA